MYPKTVGNKKPLGDLTAEAAKPEGAVLPTIIIGFVHLSNPATCKDVLFRPAIWPKAVGQQLVQEANLKHSFWQLPKSTSTASLKSALLLRN